jgi:kynurenine formamidase
MESSRHCVGNIAASLFVLGLLLVPPLQASEVGAAAKVGQSRIGPQDQLGRLSLMTDKSRADILSRVSSGRTYDLAVDFFTGMPAFTDLGDPPYQFWLTHTPPGNIHDDPFKTGPQTNRIVTYTGDAISMYTHVGTHIDALAHFGLHGRIWNGFEASKELGDKGWAKGGAETIPPIIARGVLIDMPRSKRRDQLEEGYRISRSDIVAAMKEQGVALAEGDVVLIRSGRMKDFRDAKAYSRNAPGISIEAAKYLVEQGAMIVGVDLQNPEVLPSGVDDNYMPVHTFLLGQSGVPILENVYLEELARDRIYEFAFIGGSLKFTGASGAPIRPIALPLSR